jgi:GSH-dependent disulfide-bond oxidoreductase
MRINREGMKANLMNESNPLRQLNELGQSVWLNYMRRSLISSGELQRSINGRKAAMEWLFWQVGGLGPMAGQNHHFSRYAPEKIPYAIERHVKETNRLYGVLDRRLAAEPYLAGKVYSIADIAVYPWIVPWEMQSQDLGHFPTLKRWFDAIAARPATARAYERGAALKAPSVVTDDSRKILSGQTAAKHQR